MPAILHGMLKSKTAVQDERVALIRHNRESL